MKPATEWYSDRTRQTHRQRDRQQLGLKQGIDGLRTTQYADANHAQLVVRLSVVLKRNTSGYRLPKRGGGAFLLAITLQRGAK